MRTHLLNHQKEDYVNLGSMGVPGEVVLKDSPHSIKENLIQYMCTYDAGDVLQPLLRH